MYTKDLVSPARCNIYNNDIVQSLHPADTIVLDAIMYSYYTIVVKYCTLQAKVPCPSAGGGVPLVYTVLVACYTWH